MTQIQRASQVWLIGDVGYPKTAMTSDQMPAAYLTEITTSSRTRAGLGCRPFKQPACRHNGGGFFVLRRPYRKLEMEGSAQRQEDVFGINSF